ncbi:DUF3515 domain-containing protein [Mycolicibacterium sp.]|uniref:DUF3515 domain-containing protein n=1 Tax=Mycolicibacterium sp. TaxID=2320850 RepID=UPI003D14CE19
MNSRTTDGPPRAALIAAVLVAVGAAVAVLVVVALQQHSPAPTPVAVSGVPAPQADGPDCAALVDALPDQLGDYHRAELVQPAPAGAAAWQRDGTSAPLILRCGLDRPAEFVAGTPLQVVDAVSWFRTTADPDDGRRTWFAVDRPVYVALTLPQDAGATPIQAISATIAATLPATPVTPGPVP